jgi:serine/threonine protein kinase
MSIIQREAMTDEQTWDILAQVISGLTYLHDNNIVHGDIKPSNLLVASDGTVKVSGSCSLTFVARY